MLNQLMVLVKSEIKTIGPPVTLKGRCKCFEFRGIKQLKVKVWSARRCWMRLALAGARGVSKSADSLVLMTGCGTDHPPLQSSSPETNRSSCAVLLVSNILYFMVIETAYPEMRSNCLYASSRLEYWKHALLLSHARITHADLILFPPGYFTQISLQFGSKQATVL